MPQQPDGQAVKAHLLHAIWSSTLVVRKPTSGEPMLARELLYVVFKAKPHPGFDICSTGVTRSSSSEEQADGSLVVSFHGHIMLPDDPSQWTEQQIHDAIDVLGVQGFEAFAEQFRIGVSCMSVRRDDFADYCRSAGYPCRASGSAGIRLSSQLPRPSAIAPIGCGPWRGNPRNNRRRGIAKRPTADFQV